MYERCKCMHPHKQDIDINMSILQSKLSSGGGWGVKAVHWWSVVASCVLVACGERGWTDILPCAPRGEAEHTCVVYVCVCLCMCVYVCECVYVCVLFGHIHRERRRIAPTHTWALPGCTYVLIEIQRWVLVTYICLSFIYVYSYIYTSCSHIHTCFSLMFRIHIHIHTLRELFSHDYSCYIYTSIYAYVFFHTSRDTLHTLLCWGVCIYVYIHIYRECVREGGRREHVLFKYTP